MNLSLINKTYSWVVLKDFPHQSTTQEPPQYVRRRREVHQQSLFTLAIKVCCALRAPNTKSHKLRTHQTHTMEHTHIYFSACEQQTRNKHYPKHLLATMLFYSDYLAHHICSIGFRESTCISYNINMVQKTSSVFMLHYISMFFLEESPKYIYIIRYIAQMCCINATTVCALNIIMMVLYQV